MTHQIGSTYIPEFVTLKDGSTVNMNVDGSSVNKTYKFQPSAGEEYYIKSIDVFLLHDETTMAHNVFAGLGAALTNGLRLVVENTVRDTQSERIIATIKDNTDLAMLFNDERLPGSSNVGFLNAIDYFFGSIHFEDTEKTPLPYLNGDAGDKIKVVVRDSLSTITSLRVCATVWKVV